MRPSLNNLTCTQIQGQCRLFAPVEGDRSRERMETEHVEEQMRGIAMAERGQQHRQEGWTWVGKIVR